MTDFAEDDEPEDEEVDEVTAELEMPASENPLVEWYQTFATFVDSRLPYVAERYPSDQDNGELQNDHIDARVKEAQDLAIKSALDAMARISDSILPSRWSLDTSGFGKDS
jgi:hypothetical protein